ncbi:MAG: LysR family transcriptional regulator [Dongiaceae bacterium]
MDLKRLRTFIAIADQGTMSKAAARLHISQPALSRQIANLQEELGVDLFELVGRRLSLTGAGEELLAEVRDLLMRVEALGERARSLRRGDSGVLRVAASPQMIEGAFPDFLRLYREQHPQVRVKLTEAADADQLAILDRGEVHLALNVVEADASRFVIRPLPPMELLVAWHRSLGLAGAGTIDVGSLREVPLLLLKPAYTTRKLFDAACRLARFEPTIYVESGAPHTLTALAESGFGAAVVPSTLRIESRRLQIARLAYRGQPLQVALAMLWDKRRPLPRYAEAFVEGFAEHLARVMPLARPRGGLPGEKVRAQADPSRAGSVRRVRKRPTR